MEKMILIDGNSLLNRAFYATPPFTTKDGLPTNGIFGFIKLILKIISDKKPTYFAVAFDLKAPTFRHKMYAEYKAGRKPMPDELAVQLPILKDLLKDMGIKTCELAGYEADDIIGTLSKKFKNVHSYIYTGDRDSYQLVDDTVSVCYTKKGVSDILELNTENFVSEIGLTPTQIIDLKALMGDKSDNIPGVQGVGEKSALSLLERFHDLDGIYENVSQITGALHNKLETNKETAYFSKELATIDVNVPLDISLEECLFTIPFPHKVKERFTELEFKSLIAKDIYSVAEAKEPVQIEEKQEKSVKEVFPEKVEEVLSLLNHYEGEVACYFSSREFRFMICGENSYQEFVFPMKMMLLDVGFFEYDLKSLFEELFNGKRRIIVYNVKELLYYLKDYRLPCFENYDDVAILKCLADGLANTEDLIDCLNDWSLPENLKAFGVYSLRNIYYEKLNQNEKQLYKNIELPLIRVLYDMERQGVRIDLNVLNLLSDRYHKEFKQIVAEIYHLAGEEFNLNSAKQLGNILFDKLKIGAGVKKTKESKSYKTTAEELEKYADKYEIVRLILRYRTLQKITSTYIDGFKPYIKDGKIHTTYNQCNTLTGRLSSTNPNLQNIPIKTEEGRELRKLFIAEEGNVLIDADYSQIELRLLAHFSKCKALIEAYQTNKDIHALTASQVFNVSLDKVEPSMRRQAKAVNFGIIYGISAFGLASDLKISAKHAKEYIDLYFEAYPEVKTYMDGNVEEAAQKGFMETLLGRRRVINEIKSSNFNLRSFGERAAMNMPLQGSSADIIKIAMINVHKKLKEKGFRAKLVLQVHDELLIDCPKEEMDQVSKILQNEMENAVQLSVPLTVEIGVGDNWHQIK